MIYRLPGGTSVVGRVSRLFAVCAVVAIAFVLLRGGWSEPIAPAKPARELVGAWVVVSVGGVDIPEGTTVTVDYKADGRLFIRQIGGDGSFVLPSAPKLKTALDQLDPALRSGVELNLRGEGFEIRLRRKPATPMPAR